MVNRLAHDRRLPSPGTVSSKVLLTRPRGVVSGRGLFVPAQSAAGVATLILLMIVFFMIGGVAKIVFSVSIRPFPNWGWILANGILCVLLVASLVNSEAGDINQEQNETRSR